MAKYKFYIDTGYVRSKKEEIVELPDDYTEEQVQLEYDNWVGNNAELSWWKVEDDEID